MGRKTELNNIKPTEVNYRKEDDYLSYSKLSTFAKDKVKYLKKYVLKEDLDEDEEELKELTLGTMVDLFATDENSFDDKFVVMNELPAPQMRNFCKLTANFCKTETQISDALKKAYDKLKELNDGKLRSGFAKFVDDFSDPLVEKYFETLKYGKSITDEKTRSKAYNIAQKCKYAKQFRSHCDSSEVYKKFPITFKFNGRDFGCEIDEFEICHDEKKIYLYDYKTSSFIEGFVFQSYLKFNYYIQASLYKYGLMEWAKINYPDYTVENMAFKVMDSNNYLDPLLFKTTDKHYLCGFTGFYVGSRYYKGIVQLIEELEMSQEHDVWRMSMENYNNKGVVYIPEFKTKMDEDYD